MNKKERKIRKKRRKACIKTLKTFLTPDEIEEEYYRVYTYTELLQALRGVLFHEKKRLNYE